MTINACILYIVIEEFISWINPKKDKFAACLATPLKIAAFKIITRQKNMQLIKMVFEVFELQASKETFVPFIKVTCVNYYFFKNGFFFVLDNSYPNFSLQELLDDKKFKEAGQMVELLKLQCSFHDPEVLLLPLILQNKVSIAEDVLRNEPELQRQFVTYLDDLLSPQKNLTIFLDNFASYVLFQN